MPNAKPAIVRRALEREYQADWVLQRNEVEKFRDSVAGLFKEQYPILASNIVQIMMHICQADAAVRQLNAKAPPGARHLETVEVSVRGRLTQPDVWISETLKLPALDRQAGPVYLWPTQKQVSAAATSLAVACAMAAGPAHPGADWHTVRDEEEQRRAKERAHLNEYYARQNAQAAARKAAEDAEWKAQQRRSYSA